MGPITNNKSMVIVLVMLLLGTRWSYSEDVTSVDDTEAEGTEIEEDDGEGNEEYWTEVKEDLFKSLDDIRDMYKRLITEVIDTNQEHCEVSADGEVRSTISEEELCPARCVEMYKTLPPAMPSEPGAPGDVGERGIIGYPGEPGLPGRQLPCPEPSETPIQCNPGLPGLDGLPGMKGMEGEKGVRGERGRDGEWPQGLLLDLVHGSEEGYPYDLDDIKAWVDEEMEAYKKTKKELEMSKSDICNPYCSL